MEKRHSVGICLWHVSMQTAMCQCIGNMPKACPYVMMQFCTLAYCGWHKSSHLPSKRGWGIFLFPLSDNLITEDWFFAEGERFFICWIHFNLIDNDFWGKKSPMKQFIGLFGYFGEVIVYFLWSAIQFLACTKAWIHGVTSSAWRACG